MVSLDNARSGVSVNLGAYLDRQSDQEIFNEYVKYTH